MITKSYKENKAQVMKIYEKFTELCSSLNKPVDESIVLQAEKIKNEIFNLMILGEAKSGKSTFINAYLGKEVVPMDVRQCTSAIIKIHSGNKFELIATSAQGGKHRVIGDENIKAFLKDHAAISDKYRYIPITTINNEILLKYRGKNIPQNFLMQFIESEEKDNIYKLDKNEYAKLIIEYINSTAHKWGEIITEMEITYPLPESMQGITIIDSPGVGAGGNVGVIAENYIAEANAIIFVKSLSGQALESSSFMNFMRTNCRELKKESLFLVLTGKSNLSGSETASLKEQAVEMYKRDIIEDKIIVVDSKVQLFLNKCKALGTEDKIDEFFDDLEETGNDFAPASKCWLKSKGNVTRFYEKMDELSNFTNVQLSLERFARIAGYIQLIEFLENIEKEYSRYRSIFSEALKIAKDNFNDPAALEDMIKRKKNEINEVYQKINDGVDEVYNRYTDNIQGEGIIMAEAEKKRSAYETKIDFFCKLTEKQIKDTTFAEMRKVTMDAVDDAENFRKEMADRIISDFNSKLIHYTDDPEKIDANAYLPNFTGADFDKINQDAKEQTSGVNRITTGSCFTRSTRDVPFHRLKDHVNIVAKHIRSALNDDIIPTMTENVMTYIEECRNIYMYKLDTHRRELEDEYLKLLEDKENNEKMSERIAYLQNAVAQAETGILQVKALEEELRKNVNK